MGSRPALLAFAPRPRLSAGVGSVPFSMPLGFGLGRPLTPLSVATSAFSPAITCRRASFSASSRSARASSSPRGRPERLICFEADMAETGRVRAGPAQPRQLTSARPFAPRTTPAPANDDAGTGEPEPSPRPERDLRLLLGSLRTYARCHHEALAGFCRGLSPDERLRARAALAVLEGKAGEQGEEPQPWLRLAADVGGEVWPM